MLAVLGFIAGLGHGRILIADLPWVPAMGIRYALAADGISLVLVLLTGLAAVAGVLFSWNIELRTNEFFAFYLALIGGVYGVFLSADLFLLFVFYEIAIVPKYFLIAIWGSTRREYGARWKLALYSFVGSAMVLIGASCCLYDDRNAAQWNLLTWHTRVFRVSFQMWAFPLVFIGFGVLGRHVAVSHLGSHRACCRADRCVDAAGRRGDEAGSLRMPACGDGSVPHMAWIRGAGRFSASDRGAMCLA